VSVPATHVSTSSPPARPAPASGAWDALVVAVWFAAAGLVGAVVWWQATTLPRVERIGDGAALAPGQLVRQVGIDGWFFVIAAIGGLLSAVVLLAWRRRDPLLMVVLVVLGGGLASWLMVHVGLWLGPEDVLAALRRRPEGAQVPMQLALHATGMAWVWSIAAALGSVGYLWVLAKPESQSV